MDSYKELLDTQLIHLLKQGDKAAFAEIYDRYAIMVYYKVNQMLKDEETSKDLIQDLFISIWDKADHIREEANLAGYLYIASKNRVLKLIQKGKTRDDYLTELGKYSSDISYETVHKLDEREMMLIILNEIAKLPPKMREVFQLSRLENLSHKEIAARLNISEATVRKQVQNSLGILKTTLGKYGALGMLFLALFKE